MLTLVLTALLSFGPEVPVAAPEYAPAPDVSAWSSDVATDGRDFFAVWSDARGPRGARLAANGILLDPYGIPLRIQPDAVVWTGTHYLAAGIANGEVSIQSVTRSGVAGPVFPVARLDGAFGPVALATNGHTAAITVSGSKTVIVTPEGFPLHTVTTGTSNEPAAVAPLGDGYIVVSGDEGVRYVLVGANGSVSAPRMLDESIDGRAVAVAANGDTALAVWSDGRRIRAQQLTPTGERFGAMQDVASGEFLGALELARRGSDYLLTWRDGAAAYAIRLRRSGAPVGDPEPVHARGNFPRVHVAAPAEGPIAFVWIDEGVVVASLMPSWPPGFQMPIAPHVDLSMSPNAHNGVAVAAHRENVFVAWVEKDGAEARVRLSTVGAEHEPLLVRTSRDPLTWMVGLAVEGAAVWVLWMEDFQLRLRRYNTSLQTIDNGTLQVGERGNYRAVAAGGGSVVVTSFFGGVTATVLRPSRDSVASYRVSLSGTNSSFSVATAAVWDGTAFVVAYAHGNELRVDRVGANGTKLTTEPHVIAPVTALQWVRAVRGPQGVELLWGDAADPASHASYRNAPRPAVRTLGAIWCGEPAIEPDDGGYAVVRIDCGGRGLLAERYTADFVRREQNLIAVPTWDLTPKLAIAERMAVLAYTRAVAEPPFDGLVRSFLRIDTPPGRRRSVGR